MLKLMYVFGTRPEAIKMCPLIKETKNRKNIENIICLTGQHESMLRQVLEVFGVEPHYNLHVMKPGQSLFDLTINILTGIKEILEKEQPDIVLVHGDTTTAYVVSLACFYLHIRVGHIEAGLRTYNLQAPFPEEFNRRSISILSDLDFAPTEAAKHNLLNEGKDESRIWVTGNTVIDALATTVRKDYFHEELEWAKGSRLIFMTAHRRENLGEPMRRIFRTIRRISNEYEDVRFIYPIHLNPAVREIARQELDSTEQIHIIEPLDVIDCHNIMANSYLIMTDSGGIKEEAPSLGKPVLVMRDETERPEGVHAGTLKLIGTAEESIYANVKLLLENNDVYKKMAMAHNPYGDGTACKYIADVLEQIDNGYM